jgi:MFS family permease
MGWVLAAELLPVGLLGIPAGSLIARLGAKRTMNVADAARAPLMAAVPVLYWTDHLSFPLLLAFTFAIGCFMAPYYASSRLILPEVVGEDEQLVAQGSAFVQTITQLTQLGGPILGGLLISLTSAPAVLIVDAATYAFSFVVILTFVRVGKRVEQDESSRGLFAGLRYVWRDQLLRPMACAAAFINFAAQGLFATIPVLVLPSARGHSSGASSRRTSSARSRCYGSRASPSSGWPCPSGSWRSACRGRSCSSCSPPSVSARRSSTRRCLPSSPCAPRRRSGRR